MKVERIKKHVWDIFIVNNLQRAPCLEARRIDRPIFWTPCQMQQARLIRLSTDVERPVRFELVLSKRKGQFLNAMIAKIRVKHYIS